MGQRAPLPVLPFQPPWPFVPRAKERNPSSRPLHHRRRFASGSSADPRHLESAVQALGECRLMDALERLDAMLPRNEAYRQIRELLCLTCPPDPFIENSARWHPWSSPHRRQFGVPRESCAATPTRRAMSQDRHSRDRHIVCQSPGPGIVVRCYRGGKSLPIFRERFRGLCSACPAYFLRSAVQLRITVSAGRVG